MKNKGFTLVELLAVIVIIAIIMVLATPSVISTLTSARKKTFTEYINKIYQNAESIVLSKEMYGDESSCVMYDITSDLGLDNTGDFKGYIITVLNEDEDDYRYFITLWDKNYMVYALEYKGTDNGLDVQVYDSSKTTELSVDYLATLSGCKNYTEEKTKENKVAEPIPYTGIKKGQNNWIAHYTNGEIDECYHKYSTDFCTDSWGSIDIFNYDELNYPDQIDVCRKNKSTKCCTSTLTEATNANYIYRYYIKDKRTCGYAKLYDNGKYLPIVYIDAGGGLPESGVTY